MAEIVFQPRVTNGAQISLEQKVTRQDILDGIVDKNTAVTVDGTSLSSRKSSFSLKGEFFFDGLAIDKQHALSNHDRARFVSQNKDLLYVIDQSDEASRLLQKREVSTREDLTNIIGETAHALLNSKAQDVLSEKQLKSNTLMASMIVLDLGGLRSRINKDVETAKTLAGAADDIEKDSYKPLAKKAAALFGSGEYLNDTSFFEAHPDAAAFLIERPDVVHTLTATNDSDTRQLRFMQQADSTEYQAMFDTVISQTLNAKLQSGGFNEDFFSTHTDFAHFVMAGESLDGIPKPGKILKDHPEYALGNPATHDGFDFVTFMEHVTASQAKTVLDPRSSISHEALKENVGLARLILNDSSFRNALNSGGALKDLEIIAGTSSKQASVSKDTLNQVAEHFHSSFKDPGPSVARIA